MQMKNYHAIALNDQYEGGRKSGILTIHMGNIEFSMNDGNKIIWALNNTEFSKGGTGNSLIYIKNQQNPTITLYTSDKSILKDINLQDNFNTHQNISSLKKHYYRRWIITAVVAACLLSPIILVFTFRDSIVKKIANQVPVSYEQKVGDNLFSLVSSGYTILKDSALNTQLQEIVDPLVKQVKDTAQHFSFYIINDTTVNAFALPGGKVVINSGLILKSDNWSEIQGVLAHEISHVTLRHHIRGVINKQGLFFVISVLLGGYSDMIATLAGYGSHLESLMYSRKFEREADNQAYEYLVKADVDPNGMLTFFEKLQSAHPEDVTSGFTQMLSTHPATSERIANMKSKIENYHQSPKEINNIDIKTFQQQLKKQL